MSNVESCNHHILEMRCIAGSHVRYFRECFIPCLLIESGCNYVFTYGNKNIVFNFFGYVYTLPTPSSVRRCVWTAIGAALRGKRPSFREFLFLVDRRRLAAITARSGDVRQILPLQRGLQAVLGWRCSARQCASMRFRRRWHNAPLRQHCGQSRCGVVK